MNVVNSSSGSISSSLLYTDDESPIVNRSQRPPRVQFQELCTVASSSDGSVCVFFVCLLKDKAVSSLKPLKKVKRITVFKSCNCIETSMAMLIENTFIYIKISILLINITGFLYVQILRNILGS